MSNPVGRRSKEEWDEVFEEFQPKIVTKVKFADIFKKFLAPDPGDFPEERCLPEPTLFQEDLFTWQAPRRFDVVCSFGFVEHFENFEAVVRKRRNGWRPAAL